MFFFLAGCKKEALEPREELKENISKQELKEWISVFETNISNGHKVLLDKAVTTFINKQMIVRVPLSSGGGEMIFSKNKTLEVIFFRKVSFADKISSRFTGYYESIDMINYAYKKVNYLDGIKVSSIKGKPIKSSKTDSNDNQNLIVSQSTGTWFSEFLNCLGRFVFAVPRYRNGSWECYGLGAGESDDDGGDEVGDDGDEGDVDFPPYIPIIYPPNLPSPPPGYEPPPSGSNPNYLGFRLIQGIGLVPIWENWNDWDQEQPFNIDGIPRQEPEDAPVIDLGYEILNIESDPPPDGNYPKRKIGSTNDRSNAEEKNHGTNSDDSYVKRIDGAPSFRSNSNLSDNELLSYLKVTKNVFSFWGLNDVATEMVNKFASKSGGEFRNRQLNEAVKNSQEFKNFTQRFSNLFNSKLRDAGGDINSVTSFDIDQQYRPKFTWKRNLFNGLTFLLNDTAETSVEINNFTLVNGKWTATFIITIKDWFGVDSNDVTTYQNGFFGNGFAAWWLLQHKRGYQPIQTIVSLGVTLTGNM